MTEKPVYRKIDPVQMLQQSRVAQTTLKTWITEKEREGFVFDVKLGCWVHPNGDQIWMD